MRKRKLPLFFIALFLFAGCKTMTPAQQTLWAVNVYQAQYDLYLDQVINPAITAAEKEMLKANPDQITGGYLNQDISEDQRKILRVKKQILIELKPLVIMAAEYQTTGQLPPAEVQKKLTELINRLVELAED